MKYLSVVGLLVSTFLLNGCFDLAVESVANLDDTPEETTAPPQLLSSVPVSAFFGANDTDIRIDGSAQGYDLYRADTANCDIQGFQACTGGAVFNVDGSAIADMGTTTAQEGYYQLSNGLQTSDELLLKAENMNADFSGRYGHQAVVFDDAIWVIGGQDNNSQFKNDIWRSDDGLNWEQVNTIGPIFSGRFSHQSVAFDGALWVIGGYEGLTTGTAKNDIWRSDDGITWTEIDTSASPSMFRSRGDHQVLVFDNALWVIGGQISGGTFWENDVWRSNDGIIWTEVTSSEPRFGIRSKHQAAVFNDGLWVLGGSPNTDLWRSDPEAMNTGEVWIEVDTSSSPDFFEPRVYPQVVVFDGALWLMGGLELDDYEYKNDVWRSDDGIIWTEVTDTSAFNGRFDHQVVVFDNAFWVIGGLNSGFQGTNDIWRSSDGIDWRQGVSGEFVFD